MAPTLLRGDPIATPVLEAVRGRVRRLEDRGVVPTLATVLMSDDPGDERFVELKHETCADVGIATRDVRVEPNQPPKRLYRTLEELRADPEIDAVFVQVPLPERVALPEVRQRLDPDEDVDCFHPENLGRLVAGDPRFVPATPAAVSRILTDYDVQVVGSDVAVVGRSDAIGKPLANLLLRDTDRGNATVTVCHSHTADLAAVTREADIVVTASGVPELIDGSMLSSGVVVVDVSANRQPAANESDGQRSSATADGTATDVVGDVAFESASAKASAITPVPGGVGPVTLAMLARNVVLATERGYTES